MSSYMTQVEDDCTIYQDVDEHTLYLKSALAEDIVSLINMVGASIAFSITRDAHLIALAEAACISPRLLIVTSTAVLAPFRLTKCCICAHAPRHAMIYSYGKPGQVFKSKYDPRKSSSPPTYVRGPGVIIFCSIVCLARYYVCFPSDPEDLARQYAHNKAFVHADVWASAFTLHSLAAPLYRDGAAALMCRQYSAAGVVSFDDSWLPLLPGVSLSEVGRKAAKLLIDPSHNLSPESKAKMHEFVVTGQLVDVDGMPSEHIKVMCIDDTSVLKQ